jgi:hypothetical protein
MSAGSVFGSRSLCSDARGSGLATPLPGRGGRGRRRRAPALRRISVVLDPVVSFVLLVLVLHGAPGDPVGPALLAVLLLGRVVGRALDLLRVSGEVVPHAVRQIAQAVVGHDTSLSRIARPLFTRRYNASFPRRGGHTKHRLRARPATTRPETRCPKPNQNDPSRRDPRPPLPHARRPPLSRR